MSERPPARGTRSSEATPVARRVVPDRRKTKVVEAEAYPARYDVITLDPHDTLQKGGAKARDRTTSRSQNSRAEELRESRQQQRGQRTAQYLKYQIVGSRSQLCPCPLTAQRPRRDARVAATASKLMRTLVTAMVFRRETIRQQRSRLHTVVPYGRGGGAMPWGGGSLLERAPA